MEIEIGDCRYTSAQHTAVNIESACIRGVRRDGRPAEQCGECLFFAERTHLKRTITTQERGGA